MTSHSSRTPTAAAATSGRDSEQRLSSSSFYADLAADYDDMVDTAARELSAARFLDGMLSGRQARAALDVACGTGLYARQLVSRGLQTVVGTDLSLAMLLEARRRQPAPGPPPPHWLAAGMADLDRVLRRRFDLILCMGNSLPHLLTAAELHSALRAFALLLEPGGTVALQVLNYSRILTRRETVVGRSDRAGVEAVRFYEFERDRLLFSVRRTDRRHEPAVVTVHQVPLRPYQAAELSAALTEAGLPIIERFGGPDFEPFAPLKSEVLLILARHTGAVRSHTDTGPAAAALPPRQ